VGKIAISCIILLDCMYGGKKFLGGIFGRGVWVRILNEIPHVFA
jgi:hypothetical protein